MVPTPVVETESPGPQPSALTIKLSRRYRSILLVPKVRIERTSPTPLYLVEGPGIEPDSSVLQTDAITKPAHLPIAYYTALFQVSVYFYPDVVL